MDKKQVINKLRELLAENTSHTFNVMRHLANEVSAVPAEFHNELVLQKARWSDVQQRIAKKNISSENAEVIKAQVREALLRLINQINDFQVFEYNFPFFLLAQEEAGKKMSAEAKKIYLRLDRIYQEQHFFELLSQKDQFNQPRFFVVQGSKDDAHYGLIFRLRHLIEQEYNMPLLHFDLPAMPNTKSPQELKGTLTYNLSKALTEKSPLPLKQPIRQAMKKNSAAGLCQLDMLNEKILTFDLCIHTKNWNNATKQVLKDWLIGKFWNFSFGESRQTPIFIFLNFIHQSPKKGLGALLFNKNKKIVTDIQEVIQSANDRVHALPKLHYLEYQEVADFLEEYGVLKIDHIIKENQQLPFADVYAKCRTILSDYFKANDKTI